MSTADRVAAVEAQIRADFEAHPGSWRGDPENWFREGWLVRDSQLRARRPDHTIRCASHDSASDCDCRAAGVGTKDGDDDE